MVSDILPVILESNDAIHSYWSKQELAELDPKKYVRDFRTVRLSMGQRSGHTYAVTVMAKPGDLVVEMSDHRALYTCSQTVPGVECISRKALMEPGAIFREYPTIWIMDFGFWPRTSMNEIRERLIKSVDQRMIILGC